MEILNMYKPNRPRRNSLPSRNNFSSNNLHKSKTKVIPKIEYNTSKNFKEVHESKKPKSKIPTCVGQLNYNELYTNNIRHFMDHSLSDGDEIYNDKTIYKTPKKNQITIGKRPQLIRSQPIDTPSKRLPETTLNHTPPSYESPQKYGACKKFKEDDIEHLLIEKYALLTKLMNIDENCGSPNGDNFYAGAKFNNSPSPGDLPFPPMQWINTCQAQAKTLQKLPLLLNITI